MSKFEKVKQQYPSVGNAICTKFYNEDWTSTKKYFPYMVKLWDKKKASNDTFTSASLIKLMKQFDELLPYIDDKDISSEKYKSFGELEMAILKARVIKEEKTFVRDEHVMVLDETADFIFLTPITHRGSLKYGANTRWCTAARGDEYTFNRYMKNGFLTYLISKNDKIDKNYAKIAFWSEEISAPFSGEVIIYNVIDDAVLDSQVIDAGWDISLVFKLITKFREKAYMKFKTQQAESNVKRKLQVMGGFDFAGLASDIQFLNDQTNRFATESALAAEAQLVIQAFIDNIKQQLTETTLNHG
jgi:hypothetical protein